MPFFSTSLLLKGRAHQGQQLFGFFIGLGGGNKGDVHAADLIDLIVLDLGEDQLLTDTEVIVATAIKAVAVNAAEVAYTGQSNVCLLYTSRKEARQLVRHGHYTLNGKKANIPSILVKAGDVVSVAEGSRNSDKIKLVTEANASRPVPQWLDADKNQLTAKVVRLPAREDVDMDIEEQQIVEFYSK